MVIEAMKSVLCLGYDGCEIARWRAKNHRRLRQVDVAAGSQSTVF